MKLEINPDEIDQRINKQLSRINVAILRHIHKGSPEVIIFALRNVKSIILAEQRKFHERNNIQKQGNAI